MEKIIKSTVFCHHIWPGIFWFRIFGKGLHFKNVNTHPLLFSERNGYSKCLRVGNWSIRVLPKWKP